MRGDFLDIDAPYRGVAGVLEFVEKRLDSVTPKAGVGRFEIFDELCDVTPDWVPCDVGVNGPRVV